jgi:hypothetical protein
MHKDLNVIAISFKGVLVIWDVITKYLGCNLSKKPIPVTVAAKQAAPTASSRSRQGSEQP